jgi:mRNA interferase MazF
MPEPGRGEVWLVDLGLAAKIRPCLVLSVPASRPNDRVLVTLVAHTTSPRGTACEVSIPVRFLKPGVFDAQNLLTIPHAKLVRRLGTLSSPIGSASVGKSSWCFPGPAPRLMGDARLRLTTFRHQCAEYFTLGRSRGGDMTERPS